jgi:hypothetical protein
MTGFFENIRNFLRINELSKPKMIPMIKELNPSAAKSPPIISGVSISILLFFLGSVNYNTVLNNMMDTASLMIPSPNTILKSRGYWA